MPVIICIRWDLFTLYRDIEHFQRWKVFNFTKLKNVRSSPYPSRTYGHTAAVPLHLPTPSTRAVSLLPLLYRPPFRVPPWHPVCPAMHTTLCQHWRPQTSGVVSWASGRLAIQGDDKNGGRKLSDRGWGRKVKGIARSHIIMAKIFTAVVQKRFCPSVKGVKLFFNSVMLLLIKVSISIIEHFIG